MSIYNSRLWLSDVDETIAEMPELRELAGNTVMITGATGLICSAIVDVLVRWNELHNEKINIIVAGRNKERVIERFSPYIKRDWFKFLQYDATSSDNSFIYNCDYIIHGASNAFPSRFLKEPVETMLSNIVGLKELLEYARSIKTKRVLYISSSEIYGMKKDSGPFKGNEYGFIDLLNHRNSYSIGKRAAETLCVSYAVEYDVESVIVRPGHIYGPTATETDNRVSSSWAYAVARGKNITMKSDGAQIRSYCYCLDCASAILTVLLKGEAQHAYNISNPDSIISIKEMAEILVESENVKLLMDIPTETERQGFNPMKNSSLDASDLLQLGWKGLFDASRGFSHTVQILKEKNECC